MSVSSSSASVRFRVFANDRDGYGWFPVEWAPLFRTEARAWAWVNKHGESWEGAKIAVEEVELLEEYQQEHDGEREYERYA